MNNNDVNETDLNQKVGAGIGTWYSILIYIRPIGPVKQKEVCVKLRLFSYPSV